MSPDVEHATVAEQRDVDQAWDAEITRRLDEVLDGRAELLEGEESLALVRKIIGD